MIEIDEPPWVASMREHVRQFLLDKVVTDVADYHDCPRPREVWHAYLEWCDEREFEREDRLHLRELETVLTFDMHYRRSKGTHGRGHVRWRGFALKSAYLARHPAPADEDVGAVGRQIEPTRDEQLDLDYVNRVFGGHVRKSAVRLDNSLEICARRGFVVEYDELGQPTRAHLPTEVT